uniref:Thiamine pyrophosphate enzyme central domain-containing protein n=1 Tax=Eptatretus burgeri TaxID=7764 RepID=A0A8C4NF51_EPTBU
MVRGEALSCSTVFTVLGSALACFHIIVCPTAPPPHVLICHKIFFFHLPFTPILISQGPVFLELPIDVLYPYSIVCRELAPQASHRPASRPPSLSQRMVTWYLKRHLNNLFAGAWTSRPLGPLPLSRPLAHPRDLDTSAAILDKAQRPLLLLGSQVMLPPTTAVKLRDAIEQLGFPCYLGGMARGLLGRSNVLHIRHNRRAALRQADAIVLAGAVCDFRLSYGRLLPKSAAIIAVNRDREQLMRNKGIFWRPRIAVQGENTEIMQMYMSSI